MIFMRIFGGWRDILLVEKLPSRNNLMWDWTAFLSLVLCRVYEMMSHNLIIVLETVERN